MEKIVLFILLAFLSLVIYRSWFFQERLKFFLMEGRYDQALESALESRNLFFIMRCLEEVDNNFSFIPPEQAEKITEKMVRVGFSGTMEEIIRRHFKERPDSKILWEIYNELK